MDAFSSVCPDGIVGIRSEARRRDVKRTNQPLAYPYGPLVRLMILTSQREREVADMKWSEIDCGNGLWIIRGRAQERNRAHAVPLAPEALALLKALPQFAGGEFVFSTTDGEKPVNGFSKTKERLDKLSGVSGGGLHRHRRRTMRTHLSALPIEDRVREHMIAHAQPGLHQVYDRHAYTEKSAAVSNCGKRGSGGYFRRRWSKVT